MKAAGVVGAALALMMASGCAMFNRGTLHYSRTTTMGKELVDLKDALDKGALTQDEYAKAKKDVLAGGPVRFEACSDKK
jgi:hypothetical protein